MFLQLFLRDYYGFGTANLKWLGDIKNWDCVLSHVKPMDKKSIVEVGMGYDQYVICIVLYLFLHSDFNLIQIREKEPQFARLINRRMVLFIKV